jgi:hypothetical protein
MSSRYPLGKLLFKGQFVQRFILHFAEHYPPSVHHFLYDTDHSDVGFETGDGLL